MRRLGGHGGFVLTSSLALLIACSGEAFDATQGEAPSAESAPATLASEAPVRARVATLRDRFQLAVGRPRTTGSGRPAVGALVTRSVLGTGVANGFDVSPGRLATTHVRPHLQADVVRAARAPAHVDLPRTADGAARLVDPRTNMSVSFALQGAKPAVAQVADGLLVYPDAIGGGDLLHRASPVGTEDFVAFDTRPAREELAYDVDVSNVRGLRLVSNTLEFLDEGGSPTLRVAPPYVVDAGNRVHDARLTVEGCGYDTNPAAPWGRALTPIGASHCTVRVAWSGVAYPAIVDPTWSSTGAMAVSRMEHQTVVLASKKVLLIGGESYPSKNTAEIYDENANGGAGAFAATGSLVSLHQYEPYQPDFTSTLLASGKVLVAGGGWSDPIGPATVYATAETYDPGTGTWTSTGSMVRPSLSAQSTLLASGKVLISGGYSTTSYDGVATTQLFDPASGTFADAGSLSAKRYMHTSTRLADGRVLIAGGWRWDAGGGYYEIGTADLFDGAGAFVSTVSMVNVHTDHQSFRLPSGKVLVVGKSTAELFNPATNTFASTGALSKPRTNFGASLLASGRVAVVAGIKSFASQGAQIATAEPTAEIYDEQQNGFTCTTDTDASRACMGTSLLPSGRLLVTGGCVDSFWFPGFVGGAKVFGPESAGGPCPAPPAPAVDAGAPADAGGSSSGGSSSGGSSSGGSSSSSSGGSSSGGEDAGSVEDSGAGSSTSSSSGSEPGTGSSSGSEPGSSSGSEPGSSSGSEPGTTSSASSSGGGSSSGSPDPVTQPGTCAMSPLSQQRASLTPMMLVGVALLGALRRRRS